MPVCSRAPWKLLYGSLNRQAEVSEDGTFSVTVNQREIAAAEGRSPLPDDCRKKGTWPIRSPEPEPREPEGSAPGPLATVDRLFALVASKGFLAAESEYLPPKDTFEYHGHSTLTTITFLDGRGTEIHKVTYSDKSEHDVPAVIEALGRHMFQAILRVCGPLMSIGLD